MFSDFAYRCVSVLLVYFVELLAVCACYSSLEIEAL